MTEKIESYLIKTGSPLPGYLMDLERETNLKIAKPQMLTGHIQGRFLSMISKVINPNRILEIGTFTGYGTLCLAEGLNKNGLIFTIEVSKENGWLAEKYFKTSSFNDQILLIYGNALDEIRKLKETWDLVYIDADKQNNQQYFNLVWPCVRKGGLVLIDNILARGGVFKPENEKKSFEKSVSIFNSEITKLAIGGMVTILPIRDGLTIVRKE
jgi:predicted O-methyltransferase YrrM